MYTTNIRVRSCSVRTKTEQSTIVFKNRITNMRVFKELLSSLRQVIFIILFGFFVRYDENWSDAGLDGNYSWFQDRDPRTGRPRPRTVRRPRRPRSSGTEDEQNYVEDEDEDGTRTKRKRSWRTSEDEDEVEDELVLGRPRGRGRGRGRPHLWSNEDEDEVKDELVLGDG